MLSTSTVALPFECLIACIKPDQHDPQAASSCNCDERYCPAPQGPGGPNIPLGDVWGYNASASACGPVPAGSECAGLDVTCVAGYTYGWNGVDTCQCLPNASKRATPVCRMACISPSAHDSNAVPTDCNCAERSCPTPQGPGGPNIPAGETWAFNATSMACGPVVDPQAECASLGVECVAGYTYGWDGPASACECIPDYVHRRVLNTQFLCSIPCVWPEEYDPHAQSPSCNCAARVCPAGPACLAATEYGWDEELGACGCVASPGAECVATGHTCVSGYAYGWNATQSKCECLPTASILKKQAENICDGILCTEVH